MARCKECAEIMEEIKLVSDLESYGFGTTVNYRGATICQNHNCILAGVLQTWETKGNNIEPKNYDGNYGARIKLLESKIAELTKPKREKKK